MRFIDHATDGGCSKKADAGELTELLQALADTSATDDMQKVAEALPDSAPFVLNGVDCLSTVDIVLPMVLRASDFGRVAVNHVLGDIYAAFGVPHFALSILGLPHGLQASDGGLCSEGGIARRSRIA
jgi:selenide,water dikinase